MIKIDLTQYQELKKKYDGTEQSFPYPVFICTDGDLFFKYHEKEYYPDTLETITGVWINSSDEINDDELMIRDHELENYCHKIETYSTIEIIDFLEKNPNQFFQCVDGDKMELATDSNDIIRAYEGINHLGYDIYSRNEKLNGYFCNRD